MQKNKRNEIECENRTKKKKIKKTQKERNELNKEQNTLRKNGKVERKKTMKKEQGNKTKQ